MAIFALAPQEITQQEFKYKSFLFRRVLEGEYSSG